MTLLSPSESYAFQSFLAQIDGEDTLDFTSCGPSQDWPYFTNNGAASTSSNGVSNGHQQQSHSQGRSQAHVYANGSHSLDSAQDAHAHPPEVVKYAEEAHVEALPRLDGSVERVNLARATKSLMSLDSNPAKWNESADRDIPMPPQQLAPPQRNSRGANGIMAVKSAYSRGPTFKVPLHHAAASSSSMANGGSTHRSNAVASTSSIPSAINGISIVKRPYDADSNGISISSSVGAASVSVLPSLSPSSHSGPTPKKHRSSSIVRSNSKQHTPHSMMGSKPAPLLTPSQKKANHIQSEQKRRANIRRGYEALCETVPALREAIRAEDEAQALVDAAESNSGRNKRKRGTRKKGTDTSANDGDKVDGRAGPRSENVVLQKTIDYVRDLISERESLLSRLYRARELLPRDHPFASSLATTSSKTLPLWEREWAGGIGKDPDADVDELGGDGAVANAGQDEDMEGDSESDA